MASLLDDDYSSTFSSGNPDKKFTVSNLDSNGRLFLEGVLPGGAFIVDSSGNVVDVPQMEKVESSICVGTFFDFSRMTVSGTWKVRFRRGPRGLTGMQLSGELPSDEMVKYALIFG